MKLINATPSPWGRKVAIAMHEKNIDFTVQWDIPWEPSTCVGDYSPFQQLPILLTDTGDAIYDSTYILEWLEVRYPEFPLLPTEPEALLHAKLLQIIGERLIEISAIIAFESMRAEPSAAWLGRQQKKMGTGIAEAARIVGSRALASGESITIGDITLATTLTMLEFMAARGLIGDLDEIQWRAKYSGLSDYVAALEARPSFQSTRPVMFEAALSEVVG